MRSLVLLSAAVAAAFVLSIGAAASAAVGPVTAARHAGTVAGTTIRWRSEYVLRDGSPATLDLAFPLPEGTALDLSADVAPVEQQGRVVALRVLPEAAHRGYAVVRLTEPLERAGRDARLAPPLASGDAVQLVEVTGPDDLRFEPDPRTQIDRHVGFFAPVEVPPSARDACDRAVGYTRAHALDDPLYVIATPTLAADHGIRGALVTSADRLRAGALGAGGIFAGLVVALVILQRRLARAARIEQAERSLAAEFARLDESGNHVS